MNAEALLIGFLKERVPGVQVRASVPPDRPDSFITVERTGGRADRFFDRPIIAIQAWDQTPYKASELAIKIRDALPDLVEIPDVTSFAGSSMYNWPDADSKQARYQIVTEFTINNQ